MKLVIISGRSGSGKSSALDVLEDNGFYCIDNLPAGLLPSLIEQARNKNHENDNLAVCIDARNHTDDIANLPAIRNALPKDVEIEIVYLDATSPVLVKRFSETRRKHPLSNNKTSLKAAILKEKELLEPISAIADLLIHTDNMNVHQLRDMVRKRLCSRLNNDAMSIMFSSFGFKNGIPVDADLVYDVRCLPNPYWVPELRHHSGQQPQVKAFLQEQEDVHKMFQDIRSYLEHWLPKYAENNRSYLTVAIGCTGGMHRSVYLAERLHDFFQDKFENVQVHHRELSKLQQ